MFDPEKLYLSDDPALDILGKPQTRAHWRSEGVGPPYVKFGGRVAYRGRDLNEWVESQVVRTDQTRPRRSHTRKPAEARPAA
ncbi:MAG: DNA-binding protein [Rhodospirillaceae bacterium]|nr:DNA-binding protein [Rhodospirillaceae bacterium]